MTPPSPESGRPVRRVAVVGGGITGLAAAHHLHELDPSVELVLLERRARLGGVLETVNVEGFRLERSADNFITNLPWGIDLCRQVGLEDQLLRTNDVHRQAFVVHAGKLEKIPEGFLIMAPTRMGPMVTTPILSWLGKLRLACEPFIRTRTDDDDESLANFATRRLGRETYERLVQPLVGGIYTADPTRLSVQAALPRFRDMEREHGSLTRAMWRQAVKQKRSGGGTSGARYSLFVAPREGMSSLVEAIARRLPPGAVRLEDTVESLQPTESGGWSIAVAGSEPRQLAVDAVVVATPAHAASQLFDDADPELGPLLQQIPHARCSIVTLGFRREQIGHPLDGFGFVVPQIEERQILSSSFTSVKYRHRAPEGHELIRTFVGGACQESLADLPDDQLLALVREELGELLSIEGQPVFEHISRWPPVMPQYCVGHGDLVRQIEQRVDRFTGLALAGNAYHGVGIPNCIQSGQQAAERVLGRSPDG
ncbi:MAG: protoporphyrinogen oxidase [Pirellulales bacterium]